MVFVTKYRRKVIDAQMLAELKSVFESVCLSWNCQLIEFSGESDHCHLIVSFPPQKRLSDLVGNLKATASKAMGQKFESKLSKIYRKKVFWTSSYFIASCGSVTIDTLKKYVQSQDSPPPAQP
ncbi:MAG: IS200/IS605 family transposase [Xenococcaceae cyanobacterium MO_207.B15]|nr:IS200/IS605 family transposase [Xenococcaceae cyanobacterium MO_207.B15]